MIARNRLPQFSLNLLTSAALLVLSCVTFALYVAAEAKVARTNELRYRSYLLADEWRQSGDDLTRLLRTYAATGDPAYKRHFQDILDIRDGKKPRPENYSRPYWDLVLGDGPAPRGSRQAIALLQLMRQAGFTEEEFRKLAEAQAISDALTALEFEAIKLSESTGPQAEANRARAVRMLYDDKYHRAKIGVMQPTHDFLELVDRRTLAAVQTAEAHATALRIVFVAVGLGLMFMLWRTYAAMRDTLGGSLNEVYTQIARIGSGDFSSTIELKEGLANSVLGWLSATLPRLTANDRERKRAEMEIAETRIFLDNILQSSTRISIIGTDLDRNILSWNEGAHRNYGYSAEEVIGRNINMLNAPEDVASGAIDRLFEAAHATGAAEAELQRVRKDGSRFIGSIVLTRRKDLSGNLIGYLLMSTNVSDRTRAEESLRESESSFRGIFEQAAVGMAHVTLDGRFALVNQRYADIVGRTRDELQVCTFQEITHPDDLNTDLTHAQRLLAGEIQTYSMEKRYLRKDGSPVWVNLTGSLVRESPDEPKHFVAVVEDISERKAAEAEIRRLNAGLEQLVRERTAEIEAANKELEAFSYSVAHDLRAPLRAIDGFSKLVIENFGSKAGPEPLHYLERVRANAQQMGQLIDALLSLSQLGRQALSLQPVDQARLVNQCLETLRQGNAYRGTALVVDRLAGCRGDPALLKQVWMNLLSNAFKFSAKRSGPRVEIGSFHKDGECVYFVRDNGAGFDMRYADKLFGVFQRLHGAAEFPGTGVGLAIVQRIVRRHGGKVWAEAQPGEGAVFYFTVKGASST